MKILIVDDHLARYSDIVKRADIIGGLTVHSCGNVKDAIKKLEAEQYDILVVDMLLPQTPWDAEASKNGGIEILRHLEEDDTLFSPRQVIGITAAASVDEDVEKYFERTSWTLLRANHNTTWQDRLFHLFEFSKAALNIAASRTFNIDVCFINALKSPEQKAVLALPIDWESNDELCDEATFVRRGKMKTADGRTLSIISACSMRMGGIEAAILTTKIIEAYRPRLLLMTGICAGVQGKMAMGDVLVADPTWDWTSAKWDNDDGVKRILPAPDYISIDRTLAAQFGALESDAAFLAHLQSNWQGEEADSRLKIKIKPCASGPVVIADGETLKTIATTQTREVLGLEMEAYGVYSAVRASSMPRPLVASLKGVCDFADPRKGDKFQAYAAYCSAGVAFEFLRRFGVSPTNV